MIRAVIGQFDELSAASVLFFEVKPLWLELPSVLNNTHRTPAPVGEYTFLSFRIMLSSLFALHVITSILRRQFKTRPKQ